MRRLVVVVLIATMSLSLVACGGGDEPEEEVVVPTTPAPAPTTPAEATAPDITPTETQVYEPFPTDEAAVPDAILERIEDGQPMLVFFYDDSQSATDEQTEVVDAIMDDYRGLIDLISFNVGKYITTAEDGSSVVDPDMNDTEDESAATARKVATLVSGDYLDITFTPYIVLVDEFGYTSFRFRGPVDAKTLEREILRATD